ncbi:MAG: hypothetical protein EAX96_19450 [Candidatus Lokiarchaeota archaeon]|nr:hypothetical protein [Candidatus Lokiarchaeota archaeon]
MDKEKDSKRKSLVDRLFDMVGDAIDGINQFINNVQDRILDLADNMEKRLKGEKSEEKDELKEYMKVSIKEIEEEKIDRESKLSVEPTIPVEIEEIKKEEIKEEKIESESKIFVEPIIPVKAEEVKEEEIKEEKIESESKIFVEPIIPVKTEEEKKIDVKIAKIVKIEDLIEKKIADKPKETVEQLPNREIIKEKPVEKLKPYVMSKEINEKDIKNLTVIYGVDRERAIKLVENEITTIFKLASELPSKISRLLDISVVEAQNIIRAANAMIF